MSATTATTSALTRHRPSWLRRNSHTLVIYASFIAFVFFQNLTEHDINVAPPL